MSEEIKRIEFEDQTLIETDGNYEKVCQLMEEDSAPKVWMLRSNVFVHVFSIPSNFILNFWNDGKVIIDSMSRSSSLEVPNDDISRLSKELKKRGWDLPEPSKNMMDSSRWIEFWERQYQTGLIKCSFLEQREADLLEKMVQASGDEENDN